MFLSEGLHSREDHKKIPRTVRSLAGLIDIHVHAGQDGPLCRKLSQVEAAQMAHACGMQIGLKSHYVDTLLISKHINQELGPSCFGTYVMNEGIAEGRVREAIAKGAKIVYFPTVNASNHSGNLTVLKGGRLTHEAISILRLARAAGVPIATGHLAPRETKILVDEAKRIGTKVIVTHPELKITRLSSKEQRQMSDSGIYFERTFYSLRNPDFPEGRLSDNWRDVSMPALKRLVQNIREVGVEYTILSSDLGQPDNLTPAEGFAFFLQLLIKHGFNEKEIQTMAGYNPAFALGFRIVRSQS